MVGKIKCGKALPDLRGRQECRGAYKSMGMAVRGTGAASVSRGVIWEAIRSRAP